MTKAYIFSLTEFLTRKKPQKYVTKEEHEEIVNSLEQEINDIKNQLSSQFKQEIQSLRDEQRGIAEEVVKLNKAIENSKDQVKEQIGKTELVTSKQEESEIVDKGIEILRQDIQRLCLKQQELEKNAQSKQIEEEEIKSQIQGLRDNLSMVRF